MPSLPIVLNIQVAESGLIVLHTHPGNANSLAYCIDRKYVTFHSQDPKNSGILGTIAGDDTVLLIIQSPAKLATVIQLLRDEFPYLMIP